MINMTIKDILVKELIKRGHSEDKGINIWDISNRSFRYINKEMADSYLRLRDHPRYKATIIDIEMKLLKDHMLEIIKTVGDSPFNMIELGVTNGEKAKAIINEIPKNFNFRYCPVNVNEYLVNTALENIRSENFPSIIEYAPLVSKDFTSLSVIGAELRNNKYQKNIFFILGSLLASFEINDYLYKLSQSMLPGDILIIGNGIRKGERFANLQTYKNPIFNQWLIHLMRELGYKDEEVEYNARFTNNRLEAYYKIKKNKIFEQEKRKIEIKEGDEIVVAFQYKLFANELRDFCDMYFDEVKLFHDPEEEYALIFCKK